MNEHRSSMELMQLGRDGEEVRRFALRNGEILIGCRPDSNIVLDAPSVAPRHARVFSVDGRSVLYGFGAEWPVYVNGVPVNRHALAHGDVIELAHYRLCYVDHAVSAPHDDPAGGDSGRTSAHPASAGKEPISSIDPEEDRAEDGNTGPGTEPNLEPGGVSSTPEGALDPAQDAGFGDASATDMGDSPASPLPDQAQAIPDKETVSGYTRTETTEAETIAAASIADDDPQGDSGDTWWSGVDQALFPVPESSANHPGPTDHEPAPLDEIEPEPEPDAVVETTGPWHSDADVTEALLAPETVEAPLSEAGFNDLEGHHEAQPEPPHIDSDAVPDAPEVDTPVPEDLPPPAGDVTWVWGNGEMGTPVSTSEDEQTSGSDADTALHLDILSGINQGRRVTMNRDTVVLGFNRERLVEIRRANGTLWVRCIGEQAEAQLNGEPISDESTTAEPGDVLSVQRIDIRIHQGR